MVSKETKIVATVGAIVAIGLFLHGGTYAIVSGYGAQAFVLNKYTGALRVCSGAIGGCLDLTHKDRSPVFDPSQPYEVVPDPLLPKK